MSVPSLHTECTDSVIHDPCSGQGYIQDFLLGVHRCCLGRGEGGELRACIHPQNFFF